MNNPSYSAYPNEQEVLLVEGCPVLVLDVEEILINNDHESFKMYNGKTVVLIHCYHPSHENLDSSVDENEGLYEE